MSAYQSAYKDLNQRQREAVDTIDGPLLVIAGPGTGKTQLLSTRAARIVQLGSASPQNILCLTYTDAGATEMRLRLAKIMGADGGDVAVHTFHSFGSWIIDTYPDVFSQVRSLKPIDALTRHKILEDLLSTLPLRHALAVRDEHERFMRQGAVQTLIEAFKKAGLVPDDVRSILASNREQYAYLQPLLDDLFATTLSAKRLPTIRSSVEAALHKSKEGSYSNILLTSLLVAISESEAIGKTKPLGDWRTAHMQPVKGVKVLKSAARHDAVLEAVKLYDRYQQALANAGRYDYDDMVLWAVRALQNDQDLRMEIAERYQYIMVDEYQDTNDAQNGLLNAILDANPLDAPNIMVVGDDDQAIMRFQGAELSGLLGFIKSYQPTIVSLTDNYRSGQPILDASRLIMAQTDERLESSLPELGLSKVLLAQNAPPETELGHGLYVSEATQDQAVADKISNLLSSGVAAADIAVIGRKHKDLLRLVPYMQAAGIAVNYEYRENILEDRRIIELLELAECIVTLSTNPSRANQLLPTVLAGQYWHLSATDTYKMAATAKANKTSWLDTMLAHEDVAWQTRGQWLLAASQAIIHENFTTGLDILIGRTPIMHSEALATPYAHYLQDKSNEQYAQLISHLICLRTAVLEARPSASSLDDMIQAAGEYRRSGIKLVDNNPLLRGQQDGVALMSAHGAKGREFEHVIVFSAVDSVWGKTARGHNQKISLPENLALYPAGDTESDRLRLLYVAMTRAKSHLWLTSYSQSDAGKPIVPLTYLLGNEVWEPTPIKTNDDSTVVALENSWLAPNSVAPRDLQSIIAPLLPYFRLSPTALRQFLDVCYGGPAVFLENSVFKFPSAYSASSALGQAVHQVLESAHTAFMRGTPLDTAAQLLLFNETLDASGLPAEELHAARLHGEQFLPAFLAAFAATDFDHITGTEQYYKAELSGGIPFGGKIDAIKDSADGIIVIDYKTGKPPLPGWRTTGLSEGKHISLHFNRQQLMVYKLLLDSAVPHKTVTAAELVFVEPSDSQDDYVRLSITDFDDSELERTARLIAKVYDCLVRGDMPDISMYSKNLAGIEQFEADLLAQ